MSTNQDWVALNDVIGPHKLPPRVVRDVRSHLGIETVNAEGLAWTRPKDAKRLDEALAAKGAKRGNMAAPLPIDIPGGWGAYTEWVSFIDLAATTWIGNHLASSDVLYAKAIAENWNTSVRGGRSCIHVDDVGALRAYYNGDDPIGFVYMLHKDPDYPKYKIGHTSSPEDEEELVDYLQKRYGTSDPTHELTKAWRGSGALEGMVHQLVEQSARRELHRSGRPSEVFEIYNVHQVLARIDGLVAVYNVDGGP